MIFRPTLILLLLLNACFEITAQDNVKGKIYDAQTDSTIAGVNVFNLNTKQSVRSGSDGSYTIRHPKEIGSCFRESGLIQIRQQ